MTSPRFSRPGAALLAAALWAGLGAAGIARAQEPEPFFLDPSRAAAGQAFKLSVLSYRYACNTSFSHQTVAVSKGRIDVGFVTSYLRGLLCTTPVAPHGPSFDIPALAAGRYDVWASDRAPCLVAPQPCEIAEKEEFAGVLSVGAPAGWFIQPSQVAAQKDFTLALLSEDYGNCNTEFTHTTASVQKEGIVLSFVIESHPDRVCLVDVHPFGPSYAMKGLARGKYPVFAQQMPACAYTPPLCAIDPLPISLMKAVDTLVVTGGSSIAFPGARPVRRGAGGASEAERYRLDGRAAGEASPPGYYILRLP